MIFIKLVKMLHFDWKINFLNFEGGYTSFLDPLLEIFHLATSSEIEITGNFGYLCYPIVPDSTFAHVLDK